MPTTSNYGWTTPTEGGSTGTWDTILNAAIDDIDEKVFEIDTGVNRNSRLILAYRGVFSGGFSLGVSGFMQCPATIPGNLIIPLPLVGEGMRITGVQLMGQITEQATATALLYRMNADGSITQIGSGWQLTANLELTGPTNLTEDVPADAAYFILVTAAGASGATRVHYAKVTSELAP